MKINKNILFNTLKITAASIIAILAAFALNLEFAISAGIVAILSIQPTKKETVKTAVGRFLAFLCAIIIAYICFSLIGFNVTAFSVYLLFFILICLMFKWNSAMAMDSVLITHFLSVGNMEYNMIINELLIFIIGVSAGIVANMHLRRDNVRIEKLKDDTDNQIKKILFRMSERILTQDITDYNGDCFNVLWDNLRKAQNLAETNYMNDLVAPDVFDVEYLKMRKEQCEVLYEMYKNVRKIKTTPVQAERISAFLKKVSEEYHKDNTVDDLMEDFHKLDNSMKNEPLPVERSEFEDRAKLFALLRLLEEFLELKMSFAKRFIGV